MNMDSTIHIRLIFFFDAQGFSGDEKRSAPHDWRSHVPRLALVGGKVYRWGLHGSAPSFFMLQKPSLSFPVFWEVSKCPNFGIMVFDRGMMIGMIFFPNIFFFFPLFQFSGSLANADFPVREKGWSQLHLEHPKGAHAVPRSWRGEGRWDRASKTLQKKKSSRESVDYWNNFI